MRAYPCRKENKRAVVEELNVIDPQLGVIKDDLGSPRVLPPPLFTGGDKENNNKGCSMESHLAAKLPRADPPGQHIKGPAKYKAFP